MKYEKTLQWIQWVIGAAIIVFIFSGLWDRYYPYEVTRFHSATIVNAERIVPGAVVWVEVTYDKFLPLVADSVKNLICGEKVFFLAKDVGSNAVGLNQRVIWSVVIPEVVPHGETCYIRSVYTYPVNYMRDVSVTLVTDTFKVQ